MKIASSEIDMASSHSSMELDEKTEELRIWSNSTVASPPGARRSVKDLEPQKDRVTLSAASLRLTSLQSSSSSVSNAQSVESNDSDDSLVNMDVKLQLMKSIVEAVTGKKIEVGNIGHGRSGRGAHNGIERSSSTAQAGRGREAAQEGWGLAYESRSIHYESESTSFSAQGLIKTQDGKEIGFSVSLQMSREYYEEKSISIRAGDAAKVVDPLVINFGGAAAELTDTKYAFDINSDGAEDNISFVGQGSGLLVLDLNNDGTVNNGTELFGPNTGDGFAELAAYDEDGNKWIDENDSVYEKLSVWTKDGEGNDTLSSLKDKNVGAIYLGAVTTPFDIKDESNNLDGQVVATGIYLQEDGQVGTVQQVDMVV
jgi:hypothetical protein